MTEPIYVWILIFTEKPLDRPVYGTSKSMKQFQLIWFVGALMLLLQGCMSTVKNRGGFDELRQRQGLGHFYYIGTEGEFHYFASDYLMEPIRYYRYPKAKYAIQNEFQKTGDRDKWVRFIVDWAQGTQHFKGEPPEPLVIQGEK